MQVHPGEDRGGTEGLGHVLNGQGTHVVRPRRASRDSSTVAGAESSTMITAYGAAAPYSRALLADQNAVASVVVPVGASSRVAVSSVTTARNTIAAPAPMPGASRGIVTRRSRSNAEEPSEAATSS